MNKRVAEVRKLLKEIDRKYESNPASAKCEEECQRRYAALTEKDLNKPFTI